jgi:hypothetical protein
MNKQQPAGKEAWGEKLAAMEEAIASAIQASAAPAGWPEQRLARQQAQQQARQEQQAATEDQQPEQAHVVYVALMVAQSPGHDMPAGQVAEEDLARHGAPPAGAGPQGARGLG